jgi:outer membrane lipoprotein LolB
LRFNPEVFIRRWGPLGAVALAAACTSLPPADGELAQRLPLYDERADRLERVETWSLEGRLAVSDDRDGGSGTFRWRNGAQSSRMDFHGALGRGAWRLEADDQGAELAFADGTTHRAPSVDALVREQLGWTVPVQRLDWWVRGLAAPGDVQRRALDAEGRLSALQQDGWDIEYDRYGDVGDVAMPFRMTARQQGRTVKIAVKKWRLLGRDEPEG